MSFSFRKTYKKNTHTYRSIMIIVQHKSSTWTQNEERIYYDSENERYVSYQSPHEETPSSFTFLVLASRLGKVYVYRFNKSKSLWLFGPTNVIRKSIIYMITNQIFEFFVILTILVNCVFLALDNAPEEAEYVFTAIYTTEMILKIIAKGFVFHSFAYLRDPWNWLDFIVVLLGYMTLAPGMMVNFSGIRTFRVLRALRTISAIEGLKTMVNALLKSMRMLSDVLILTAFFICVFALVGLQLFSGDFHNKCVKSNLTISENKTWLQEIKKTSNWYEPIQICGNVTGSMVCPSNYTCLPDVGENPNFGFTSYDNFGWALLTSFQLVTLDFWEDVYLHIGSSMGPWYVFYFMIVIFFGSFYLINLVLAVVAVSYQQETAHNADLESQYEFLRQVASSYSLHKRILPKLLFDDPNIDSISNLSCVKQGPSVIILSSTSNTSKATSNTIALGRVFHPKRARNQNKGSDTPKTIANQKLTSIINRVKLDRVKDKLRNDISTNKTNAGNAPLTRKLNIASVRSVGRTLHVPTASNQTRRPTVTRRASNKAKTQTKKHDSLSVKKPSLSSRVSSRLNADTQTQFPEPFADVDKEDLKPSQKLRLKVYNFVMSPWFELGVTLFILLNTICLALEYDRMNPKFKQALDISNHTFTGIFIVEMVLKLIAFSPFGYVKSKWNIFDGLVVILSVIDLCIEIATTTDNGDFTIIRSLRLFRVLKLAQSWSTMRLLLSAIGRSLNALGNLTLILGIIVYVFAVVGTHVFGDSYKPEKFEDNQVPVWNFNNFGHSIMVIFRVLCGEWIEPLYDCMQTTGTWAAAFFMPALIVGNFLVLNLFLALLLNSFADQAMEEELKKRNSMKSKLKWISSTRKLARLQNAFKGQRIGPDAGSQMPSIAASNGAAKATMEEELQKSTLENKDVIGSTEFQNGNAVPSTIVNLGIAQNKNENGLGAFRANISPTHSLYSCNSQLSSPKKENKNNNNNNNNNNDAYGKLDPFCPSLPCCFFGDEKTKFKNETWTKFRMQIKTLIENKWFENGILVLIAASSLILVFEDIYLSTKPNLVKALDILNIIFCVLFFFEFVLKVIGLGVYTYVKNPWNCLDFVIVMVSIVSVINIYTNSANNIKTLRSLRTLRALRPLRAVSRWDGMRIVVNSLLKAIPSIGNVLLVCLVFWLIFSILGVQFFGGKFFKCVDHNGNRLDAKIIPNKTACLVSGYSWKNSHVNFDNALNGFLPLLQVATFEGWIEVMRDAVDATKIDEQPVRENNFVAYFYFVIFIIIGAFFILNLFISVIIDNFYRLKKQYDDGGTIEVFLTTEQKQWFSTVKKALTKKPKRIIHRPQNYYHAKIFDLTISPKFETFTMFMILSNIFIMMFQHYQQPAEYTKMLHIVNIVFTVIFIIEMIVRIIGLRHQYFTDKWNLFDFVIVILSVVGIILEYMNVILSVTPSVLRVARVLRIGRLLRYFNSAKGIRRLLVALVISLPALVNIGALLFLILFIYAIIGMSNFGYVRKHGALNNVVNFETFGNSVLVLFRLASSAGWNEVLDALMVQPPDCDPNYKNIPNGNCGSPWIAVVYLVTFILITYLIIVNMYIAVILENFNQAHEQEEIGITDEDIEMFYAVWQLYDPLATQYIEFEKLPYLVANLGAPLGIPFPNKVAVHNLNLPMRNDDKIHCIDVLQALLERFLGNMDQADTEHYDNMKKTIDQKLQAAFPIRQKDDMKTTTMDRLKEVKAALVIQRHFRNWKAKTQKLGEPHKKYSNDSVFHSFISVRGSKTPHTNRTRKKPIHRLLSDAKVSNRIRTSTITTISPILGVKIGELLNNGNSSIDSHRLRRSRSARENSSGTNLNCLNVIERPRPVSCTADGKLQVTTDAQVYSSLAIRSDVVSDSEECPTNNANNIKISITNAESETNVDFEENITPFLDKVNVHYNITDSESSLPASIGNSSLEDLSFVTISNSQQSLVPKVSKRRQDLALPHVRNNMITTA
ncbi:sodium channel protein 1 brain-like isoform X3 [Hydractinia symbiolongicarpus]|uniref:sodium channel protein 1 brain-like isoform X3 n=1 Tax=Hydractinia symbiolongicarpus TaxID=13093 RepID=UPI00254DA462|nr:sodium channel protein 1 brain-like isoform X3 [Hydractinia symbiolongicarpus]